MASLHGIAIGPDGLTMLAVQEYVYPRISYDGGQTWEDIVNAEFTGSSGFFWACAIGADNLTMLVGTAYGELFMSIDGGENWTIIPGPLEGAWGALSGLGIGGDNQTMVLCGYGERCWITTNRWSTYSQIRPVGDANGYWNVIAISSNNMLILAAENSGRIYLSTDGGDTDNWAEIQPAGDIDQQWTAVAIGADNLTMFAGISDGAMYRSGDAGGTWFAEDVNGEPTYWWNAAAMGGVAMYAVLAGDVDGFSESDVYRGVFAPYVPPDPPDPPGPPEFPVINKFGIAGYYDQVTVDEVEIIKLPAESVLVGINGSETDI